MLPEVPEAACIFHKGSYDTLHKSYAVLLNYIEENGYEICGNIRESYIDGVWNKDTVGEWLPLFGANARGDFVAMPTCWPFDERSNPAREDCKNIINLDIDLLLEKKTFSELKEIAANDTVCSVPGVTFQAQLSDKDGNVLQIIPGQGYQYKERPIFSVLTNFSPFKGDRELHPWMGIDRYEKAVSMLEKADVSFDVADCFEVLKATSQTVCPTVVSMVFDVTDCIVYWCENRKWEEISRKAIMK